ncbi:hypothetical protein GRW77_13430 [Escherichia coli]|uniref:TIGR04141 family sporadically distributed protein n=1 Tax=Enterobacter mori TaxID=539813 RepID=UPI001322DCDE|nr:TIGR04141 family sporadically distributed protein [Enterobacter mori]MEB7915091.1 TIGR04141 family sporadically distributed protein [Enterobacter mori]MWO99267.1 hypothetical protein [Escherichia coli]MXG72321.1 hypothetical protein [Escherichia coli]
MMTKSRIDINVYLLRERSGDKKLWEEKEFISKVSGSSTRKISTNKYIINQSGVEGILYVRNPIKKTSPEWLDFIQPALGEDVNTNNWKNQSVSALLVIDRHSRQFAIAFGHGRHLLESRVIEDRFGIKVVLNSVLPDKIRSIDRQTFEASPKISRVQAIKASSVSDYSINPEQDLLRALVGDTKDDYAELFGKVIAGIDSFKASIPNEVNKLNDFLSLILERSISKDYLEKTKDGQPSEFSWVENLAPVKNKELIEQLETVICSQINSGANKNIWMAIPDILDWSGLKGFKFHKNSNDSEVYEILDLELFVSTFKPKFTIDKFKRKDIYIVYSNETPDKSYPAYKCLYCEVKYDEKLFILNGGSWYQVDNTFQDIVEKYYLSLPKKKFELPFSEYCHNGEGDYNKYVCDQNDNEYHMFDRELIRYGGSYDKIEVCDVFKVKNDNSNGEFIHVKRGRSSSSLSHLFSQGYVASTLMVRESGFVIKLNEQLKIKGIAEFHETFEAKGYDVVFAIIDGEIGKELDIPFFSKVTLQNIGKSISSYGYVVKLMHIPESAEYLEKVAEKKRQAAEEKKAKQKLPRKVKEKKARVVKSKAA